MESVYIPEHDFVGPYFYYPMACYSNTSYEMSYPIIGFVKNGNEVEKALVDEYKMIFASQ